MGKWSDGKREWTYQTIFIKETGFKRISKVMVKHIMEKPNNRPKKKNLFTKSKDIIKKRMM